MVPSTLPVGFVSPFRPWLGVVRAWCEVSASSPVSALALFCACQKGNLLVSFWDRDRFLWKRWIFKNNLVVTGPNVSTLSFLLKIY